MKPQFLVLCVILFLSACNMIVKGEEEIVISETSLQCTSTGSTNCLDGTTLSIIPKVVNAACGDYELTYNFKQVGVDCQLSNFVFNLPFAPNEITGCVAGHESGTFPQCSTFFSSISSPYKVDIAQGSPECGQEDFNVTIKVSGAVLGWGDLGLKGGQNCQLCQINAWVIASAKPTCSSVADCDDHDPCTTDSCDSTCGHCVNTPIANCEACEEDEECARELDPCGEWTCAESGTCTRTAISGCTSCVDTGVCNDPYAAEDDCRYVECTVAGTCEVRYDEECCNNETSCEECVAKIGCAHALQPDTNETCVIAVIGSDLAALNLTRKCPITEGGDGSDGDGSDGDGDGDGSFGDGRGGDGSSSEDSTGTTLGISIAATAAGLGLVGTGLAAGLAGAAFWLKSAKQKAIASKLASVGFNADEVDLIMNSDAYTGNASGENPFFIERVA